MDHKKTFESVRIYDLEDKAHKSNNSFDFMSLFAYNNLYVEICAFLYSGRTLEQKRIGNIIYEKV